jgi:hypothetical protein
VQFKAVQEQPEIAKNEVICMIHREMYRPGCNQAPTVPKKNLLCCGMLAGFTP